MANKLVQKIFSGALSVTVTISCLSLGALAGTSQNGVFTDDFSDAAFTAASWQKQYGSAMPDGFDASFTVKDGALQTNRKDGDWGSAGYDAVAKAVKSASYRLAADTLPSGVPETVSGRFRWSQYVGDMRLAVVQSGDASELRCVNINLSGGTAYVQKIKNDAVMVTDPLSTPIAKNVWYGFLFTYTRQADGKYSVAMQITDESGASLYDGGVASNVAATGIYFAVYGSMDPIDYDDITVRYPISAETQAAQFREDYAQILGKTLQTITAEDEAAVAGALTAYESLSQGAQALLDAQHELLRSLAVKVGILKAGNLTEDFSDAARTELLWEKAYGLEMPAGFDATFAVTGGVLRTNRKDGDWGATNPDAVAKAVKAATYTIRNEYLSGEPAAEITGRFQLSTYANNVELGYYDNPDTGETRSLSLLIESGTTYVQNRVNGQVTETNPLPESLSKGVWYGFAFQFSQSGAAFSLSSVDGTSLYQAVIADELPSSAAAFTLYGSMDPIDYDDIVIKTAQEAHVHTYGDWIMDRYPTYSTQGQRHRDCILGDDTQTEAIGVLTVVGDVNLDGASTAEDLILIKHAALGDALNELQKCYADINEDQSVDVLDIVRLKRVLAGLS